MKQILICLLIIFSGYTVVGQIDGIKVIGDTCDNFTLTLQATGTSSSPYFFWNFGDPASGTADTVTITGGSVISAPTHVFPGPGVYTVCVSLREPDSEVTTVCRTFFLGLCCSGFINANDSCRENGTTFTFTSGTSINSINWNFGDPASGPANTSALINPVHTFSDTGTYTVTATVNAGCGVFTTTYDKRVINCLPPPACTGTVFATDSCLASGTSFTLQSPAAVSAIQWNFGDPASGAANTSASINPVHLFSAPGNYIVTAVVTVSCGLDTIIKTIDLFRCDTAANETCRLELPSSFTPNGDSRNDFFGPILPCIYETYDLLIYNRWGQMIFRTRNPGQKWNGTFKGVGSGVGTYVYVVNYKLSGGISRIKRGNVLLLR